MIGGIAMNTKRQIIVDPRTFNGPELLGLGGRPKPIRKVLKPYIKDRNVMPYEMLDFVQPILAEWHCALRR